MADRLLEGFARARAIGGSGEDDHWLLSEGWNRDEK
jgi:hypothetical protein